MNEIIDINLLPGKAKRRRLSKLGKQTVVIGIFVAILLVGMYGGNMYMKFQKVNYLDNLNMQIDSLKNVQNVLDERNDLGNKLFYYETNITSLTKKQTVWNNLIDEIAEFMPKEAVIESLNMDRKTGLIKIMGYAPDFQKLAWTFNAISSNKDFMNVKLEDYSIPLESKSRKQEGPNNATFTISFQWKGMKK